MIRTIEVKGCDFCGNEHDRVVSRTVVIDGVTYKFEVCPDETGITAALDQIAERGRQDKPPATARPSRKKRDRSGEVRAWARTQGIAVSDRGRISGNVVAQYEAAH